MRAPSWNRWSRSASNRGLAGGSRLLPNPISRVHPGPNRRKRPKLPVLPVSHRERKRRSPPCRRPLNRPHVRRIPGTIRIRSSNIGIRNHRSRRCPRLRQASAGRMAARDTPLASGSAGRTAPHSREFRRRASLTFSRPTRRRAAPIHNRASRRTEPRCPAKVEYAGISDVAIPSVNAALRSRVGVRVNLIDFSLPERESCRRKAQCKPRQSRPG